MKRLIAAVVLAVAGVLPAMAGKAVVYVEKFTSGVNSQLAEGGLEELQTRVLGNVVSSRKYEVVERDKLAEVQKELRLVDAGMTEGEGPESNRLKAAGYIIYGNVIQCRGYKKAGALLGGSVAERYYGTVELQIRIANITTGRILAAKTIEVKKDQGNLQFNGVANTMDLKREVMVEAIKEAAQEVVFKLNDVAFPVYVVSANARTVTGNVTEEQVKEGEVWEVFVLGDALKDPQTGDDLGFDEELLTTVRVSRPGAKTTKFEYCDEKGKKDILSAKEDGEKMILRRAAKSLQPGGRKAPPKTDALDNL